MTWVSPTLRIVDVHNTEDANLVNHAAALVLAPTLLWQIAPALGLFSLSPPVASSLFTFGLNLRGWLTVGAWLALFAGIILQIRRWSCRVNWGATHQLALAGGCQLTYAWQGFPHIRIMGSEGTVDLIGHSVFAVGAIVLLVAAVLAFQRRSEAHIPQLALAAPKAGRTMDEKRIVGKEFPQKGVRPVQANVLIVLHPGCFQPSLDGRFLIT